ncbi:nicotinate phosphoribosyltransferase [bacterium]|nr:nicotinate phosphoribosyltransferase [bacterium]
MPWVTDSSAAMLVDLYEVTMAAAYRAEGIDEEPAAFELWVRSLPAHRNFLVASGIDDAIDFLDSWQFDADAIGYLESLDRFDPQFLKSLAGMGFDCDVSAVQDGTIVFGSEPLIRVSGPLLQAQMVETFLLNAVGFQTMVASKAARVRLATGDTPFADFGARRAHAADAALKGAKAAFVGGASSTSLVLAGREYGIPVSGTMAHSYVLAHDSERDAFLAFARQFPLDAVLLIDTYDTADGARIAAEVATTLATEGISIRGVRLDSGDLASLAHEVRGILDDAGHDEISIFASGGLDEHSIAALKSAGAPIDAYGVGTSMTASIDAPHVDVVYKLVHDRHGARMKTSTGKETLPGAKQVFRNEAGGHFTGDVIAVMDESLPGTPLLGQVMAGGERVDPPESVRTAQRRLLDGLAALPEELKRIDGPADPPYPVEISAALSALRSTVIGSRR